MSAEFTTLCSRCLIKIECNWPDKMTWDGRPVPCLEYVANALRSTNVMICCDDCLEKMPDVELEDLKIYGRDN